MFCTFSLQIESALIISPSFSVHFENELILIPLFIHKMKTILEVAYAAYSTLTVTVIYYLLTVNML